MSLEKAKAYLKKFGLDNEVMEFDVSSATVKEAAEAINCREEEIAKSLSFIVDDRPILIVAAGDRKIDNKKFKAEFSTKAKMIPFDMVEELTGHAVGGVCPFGVKDEVTVYLDESIRTLPVVYPACGSSNSAIKLTVDRLEEIVKDVKWVDVCRSAQ